ncbi:uncharacterized protein LOC114021238 isoform X3 [Chelonia mydas]|uniref:uncharacterized protein LOC114021238 isoform X3 n=1 Tax=Chelonia mydas TaxID=8469 RepID=UPI0018A1FF36|nr:uncharacterized protein LOC114021238 isoform X3 [Chelonia mydas]
MRVWAWRGAGRRVPRVIAPSAGHARASGRPTPAPLGDPGGDPDRGMHQSSSCWKMGRKPDPSLMAAADAQGLRCFFWPSWGDLAAGAVKAALGLCPEPLPGVGDVAEGHVGNDSCECQQRLARIKSDGESSPAAGPDRRVQPVCASKQPGQPMRYSEVIKYDKPQC